MGSDEYSMKTGDYSRASSLFEESLALGWNNHLTNSDAMELRHLGTLALREGDNTRAMTLLAESIHLFQQEGSTSWVVKDLMPLAELAAYRRQPLRAAHIGGAIEAIAAQIKLRVPPQEQLAFERVLADARCQVDAGEWIIAWARGRTMSIDEAIDYAVSDYPSDSC